MARSAELFDVEFSEESMLCRLLISVIWSSAEVDSSSDNISGGLCTFVKRTPSGPFLNIELIVTGVYHIEYGIQWC